MRARGLRDGALDRLQRRGARRVFLDRLGELGARERLAHLGPSDGAEPIVGRLGPARSPRGRDRVQVLPVRLVGLGARGEGAIALGVGVGAKPLLALQVGARPLDGFDGALEFDPGPMTVLVGPNNSGKSLFLREVLRWIRDGGATSGLILDGVTLTALTVDEVRQLLLSLNRSPQEVANDGAITIARIAAKGPGMTQH
jgi:hypothetical protein